jgi:hypothetical protein
MKLRHVLVVLCLLTLPLLAADDDEAPAKPANGRKVEKPVNFVFAKPDAAVGDYQGEKGSFLAQVWSKEDGTYQANVLNAFDTEKNVVAILQGKTSNEGMTFTGNGWTGIIKETHFTLSNEGKTTTLNHITRISPTMGATPPKDAIVLFDGKNLDAWAKKSGKDWLTEDGPAKWKLLDGGVMEVVPGSDCIITHRKFGDCHVHVEFRTLGTPSNSGVFLEDRYEANINETYGRTEGSPNAGFDNCTENAQLRIRPCFPPLAWQTFDIDFRAPRFDASGNKTANAVATVLFNGVKIYDHQQLDLPHGAARRMGEAPTGPLMLQEHGMPVQFRNVWVVESHD